MRLIAHRGNIEGKSISPIADENNPSYVQKAVDAGFDVEVDVWYDEGEYFLGHDNPKYHIELNLLEKWSKKVFVYSHCKNIKAASMVPFCYGLIPFSHDEDPFVILPDMHLWVHPKAIDKIPHSVKKNSIVVAQFWLYDAEEYFGVCTDCPGTYKRIYKL